LCCVLPGASLLRVRHVTPDIPESLTC
jgi:hypothetical protein